MVVTHKCVVPVRASVPLGERGRFEGGWNTVTEVKGFYRSPPALGLRPAHAAGSRPLPHAIAMATIPRT